ncbi:MAG: restriction endonuclease subunit S [Pseudohongiellaceae bacterium]|nr:restriction endonuclease subunit S [Pseudohongiellaceae bacterium]
MSSGWIEKTLDEVCTKITDGAHRSPKSVSVGKPMSSVKDMDRFGLDLSSSRLISEEDFDSLVKEGCKPEVGDVLIAKDGNSALDTVCNVSEPIEAVLLSSVAILRPNQELVDSDFLKYLLSAPENVEYLKRNFISGVAIPRVVLRDFKKAVFKFPELNVQKKISAHLGVLDAKIKLNTQLNQNLEFMAQALFKSWFVDFDPVIDNALAAGNPIPEPFQARAQRRQQRLHEPATEGQPPLHSLPAELRQLFPDSFQETEPLGWVPKGWEVLAAADVATVTIGKTPPRKEQHWFSERPEDGYAWISIRDMGENGVYISDSNEYLIPGAVEKFNVVKVPKGSVILSFKLTLGRVAIASEELTTNEAIAHFYNFRKSLNEEYLYLYLSQFEYSKLGSTSSIATAINSKIVKGMPVLAPDSLILDNFKIRVESLFNRISLASNETKNLKKIRDSLLPKLLSGQLRIPDTEAQLAEVDA